MFFCLLAFYFYISPEYELAYLLPLWNAPASFLCIAFQNFSRTWQAIRLVYSVSPEPSQLNHFLLLNSFSAFSLRRPVHTLSLGIISGQFDLKPLEQLCFNV